MEIQEHSTGTVIVFELLHSNDIGARPLVSPALVDGTWYIRTSRELIAIGH